MHKMKLSQDNFYKSLSKQFFLTISKFLLVIKNVNDIIFIKQNEDSMGGIQLQIDYIIVTLWCSLHGWGSVKNDKFSKIKKSLKNYGENIINKKT